MAEKNYYYYDLQIINNSTNDDLQLMWEDRRNNSILQYNSSKKYSMMVNELIIDTDYIPLFIFSNNKYLIKITNTSTLATNQQYLTFNTSLDSIYPLKSDYRVNGIYYIYQLLKILNRALGLALAGVGYSVTDLIFRYNPNTKLFYLIRSTAITTMKIEINSDLMYLLDGFYSSKSDATFWTLITDDTLNLSEQAGGYNTYIAEYSSLDNWRQVTSLNMYIMNNLNITNSFTYTYDFNQLNYSENKEKSQLLLRIFYPEVNDLNNRIKLFFKNSNYPTGLKNLESNSLNNFSFARLSFKIMVEFSDGTEYPLYLDKSSHIMGELVIEESN